MAVRNRCRRTVNDVLLAKQRIALVERLPPRGDDVAARVWRGLCLPARMDDVVVIRNLISHTDHWVLNSLAGIKTLIA